MYGKLHDEVKDVIVHKKTEYFIKHLLHLSLNTWLMCLIVSVNSQWVKQFSESDIIAFGGLIIHLLRDKLQHNIDIIPWPTDNLSQNV